VINYDFASELLSCECYKEQGGTEKQERKFEKASNDSGAIIE